MDFNKENLPFSQRYGFEKIEDIIQTNEINQTLRTELWNAYFIYIQRVFDGSSLYKKNEVRQLNKICWIHFFKRALDDFPDYDGQFGRFIRDYIEKEKWYGVYNFFEFLLRNIWDNNNFITSEEFTDYINNKLEENNSAYILNNKQFIPISNKSEVEELQLTRDNSIKYQLLGVLEHLNSAISLLSQKPRPDLRNSIKESISMVEAISRIIEPKENTLGKALNKLSNSEKINQTLKAGFEKLYAYTNDKNGIRHALMDDKSLEIEDARFFLISCSAFTNYLIEKARKENLLK